MRKLFRSRKALSPVVAAIILIAVTVAVSIAVAAWMGALTFTFMKTEEVKIVSADFTASGVITINVRNTGTAPVKIVDGKVDDAIVTIDPDDVVINQGLDQSIDLTFTWTAGRAYNVAVVTANGNVFTYRGNAPSP